MQPTSPYTPEAQHRVPLLSPLNSLRLRPASTSLQMNGQRLSLSGFGRRSRLGVIKALCGANCWLNADSQQPPLDRTPLTPPPVPAVATLRCHKGSPGEGGWHACSITVGARVGKSEASGRTKTGRQAVWNISSLHQRPRSDSTSAF